MKIKDTDIVIIHQPGKVASSSLGALFKKLLNCSGKHIKTIENDLIFNNKYIVHTHSHDVCKNVLDNNKEKNILIISAFRNPVDLRLSSVFQNLSSNNNYWYLCGEKDLSKKTTNQIHEHMIKKNFYEFKNLDFWFEGLKFLDFDIYSKNFNFEKKCMRHEINKKTMFLFIRFEDIEEWPQILQKQLEIEENFVMPKMNVADNKSIKKQYNEIKNMIYLSDDMKNTIKNNKFVKIVYSETEIENMINKY